MSSSGRQPETTDDPSGRATHCARVVVLGANSFSGQDFVDLLLDDPDRQVLGISRSAERSRLFLRYKDREREQLDRYVYHALDLNRDLDVVIAMIDDFQPDAIVNFAAQSEVAPSWDHPEHWFQTNTVALAKLVNHLRRSSTLSRFVQISSPEVYGTCEGRVLESAPLRPSTPYAASKAAADLLLETYRRQFDFPLVTVRATNVYGARQQLYKIIPRTAVYLRLGRRIPLHGGGEAVKSYIHIRDVSRGELACLERGQLGAVYHLSPPAGISVRAVVERLCQLHGMDIGNVVDIVSERPGQDAAYVIDSSRAQEELGWQPRCTIEDGLREVSDWVESEFSAIQAEPLEYEHRE